MLELVEVRPLEQVEGAVDVFGIAAVHETDERGLVSDDEGRDPEHVMILDRVGVGLRQGLSRTTGFHLGADRSRIEPYRRRDLGEHLVLGDLGALLVAGGESSRVPVEELVGELVANGDGPAEGFHAGALVGRLSVPDGGLALFDMDLIEREREKRDVPISTGAQTGHDGLVAVACERAAVIERHCELTSHGLSSGRLRVRGNDSSAVVIPRGYECPFTSGLMIRPRANPKAAPATTSEA